MILVRVNFFMALLNRSKTSKSQKTKIRATILAPILIFGGSFELSTQRLRLQIGAGYKLATFFVGFPKSIQFWLKNSGPN